MSAVQKVLRDRDMSVQDLHKYCMSNEALGRDPPELYELLGSELDKKARRFLEFYDRGLALYPKLWRESHENDYMGVRRKWKATREVVFTQYSSEVCTSIFTRYEKLQWLDLLLKDLKKTLAALKEQGVERRAQSARESQETGGSSSGASSASVAVSRSEPGYRSGASSSSSASGRSPVASAARRAGDAAPANRKPGAAAAAATTTTKATTATGVAKRPVAAPAAAGRRAAPATGTAARRR